MSCGKNVQDTSVYSQLRINALLSAEKWLSIR